MIGHISHPFGAGEDHCFVEGLEDCDSWHRISLAKAREENLQIIACRYCDKPATQLDHFWPYHSEYTLCQKHKKLIYSSLRDRFLSGLIELENPLFKSLEPIEKAVFWLRLGPELLGLKKQLSRRVIGEILGFSGSKVWRIEDRALRKLQSKALFGKDLKE